MAIWDAFNAMGSPANGAGFTYLTQVEIAAYCQNYGVKFTPFELDLLRDFDRIAGAVAARHRGSK